MITTLIHIDRLRQLNPKKEDEPIFSFLEWDLYWKIYMQMDEHRAVGKATGQYIKDNFPKAWEYSLYGREDQLSLNFVVYEYFN